MGVLGKVTGDLQAPRGPDVTMQVVVPVGWFGRDVAVVVPRNLHCAACEGGGCDRCDRSGAVSLRERGEESPEIRIRLPEHDDSRGGVCLRLPEEGGAATSADLPRGHLLLTVKAGDAPSAGVALAHASSALSPDERKELMKKSLVMAAVLIALFFGMLKLSGWL